MPKTAKQEHPFGEARKRFADKKILAEQGTIFNVLHIESNPDAGDREADWIVNIRTKDNRDLTIGFSSNEARDQNFKRGQEYLKVNGTIPNCALSIGKKSGAYFINHVETQ